jgi:hypothetical protein
LYHDIRYAPLHRRHFGFSFSFFCAILRPTVAVVVVAVVAVARVGVASVGSPKELDKISDDRLV